MPKDGMISEVLTRVNQGVGSMPRPLEIICRLDGRTVSSIRFDLRLVGPQPDTGRR